MLDLKKADNLVEEKEEFKEGTSLENRKIQTDQLLSHNNNHIRKLKWNINITKYFIIL